MRFIELLFGFSPDNNSGATEAAIFFSLIAGIVAIAYVSRRIVQARQRDLPS